MKIEVITVGPLQENCIVVYDEYSKDCIIVDPGADGDEIYEFIENLNVKAILATHGHLDHIGQVGYLKGILDIPFYLHKEDEFLINNEIFPNFSFIIKATPCPNPDFYLKDGDILDFSSIFFKVIHTSGHTPGSVCFYNDKEKVLISGDTLFNGSIGRVDLPGGNGKNMDESLKKLIQLPDDTIVYPGHGPTTTIGKEKKINPYLTGVFKVRW